MWFIGCLCTSFTQPNGNRDRLKGGEREGERERGGGEREREREREREAVCVSVPDVWVVLCLLCLIS